MIITRQARWQMWAARCGMHARQCLQTCGRGWHPWPAVLTARLQTAQTPAHHPSTHVCRGGGRGLRGSQCGLQHEDGHTQGRSMTQLSPALRAPPRRRRPAFVRSHLAVVAGAQHGRSRGAGRRARHLDLHHHAKPAALTLQVRHHLPRRTKPAQAKMVARVECGCGGAVVAGSAPVPPGGQQRGGTKAGGWGASRWGRAADGGAVGGGGAGTNAGQRERKRGG